MNKTISKIYLFLAMTLGLTVTAMAANSYYAAGDLMLTFQKAGNTNTVYVDLGNAATLYRGAAAGPDAANKINFLDINVKLTEAFGPDWATDPDIFAGLSGVYSKSDTSTVVVNGDAARTVYVSASRDGVGTVGAPNSNQWVIFGDTDLSNAAADILTQNDFFGDVGTSFPNGYNAQIIVSPTSASKIDNLQPLTIFQGVASQGVAFRAFEGGIQQQGNATSFGTFGAAGSVEFALDLYRIVAVEGLTNEIAGTGNTGEGTYEGTITVGSNGMVSFVTQGSGPVVVPAAIDTPPASITINSGGTTTLSVTASGTGPLTYQWYEGSSGSTATPVGTNSASFTTPALTTTTSYWVKVTNTANVTGADSNTATVTVNQPAAIATPPASVTINSGVTTTLNIMASGTAPFTYQWYQGISGDTTNPVSGETSDTFTTPILSTTTSYWVKVTNAANPSGVNSPTATVTVNQPAAIVTSPASVTINSGDTTTLSVTASGTTPLTYQWYQGTSGTTTTPVGTNSASFTTPVLTSTTNYWVKITNAANLAGADSATATVTVNQPAAIVTSPASVTINSGDTTTLGVTASGTGPLTYQWYQGTSGTTTTPVGTNSASFTTPILTSTTSYWVKFTNAANLTGANSTTATVSVNQPAAIVTSPASVTINSGDTTTLGVTASGTAPLTYQWYQGTSGTTTTPVGTNSASFTTPALTSTTSYWVKVTNAANLTGSNSSTATVSVNQPAAIVTSPASVAIISGDTTTLSVTTSGTAPLTYQWYQGSSGTTTTPVGTNSASFTTPVLSTTTDYWVKVTNAANLTGANSATATVTVNQPAAIVTSPASVTINSGETTTLSVTASGTAPLTYQWYQGTSGDTTTPVGTNSASFTTPALTSTTSYWVKITNVANLSGANSSTSTVTVNQPAAIVTPPASVTISSGDTTTLNVTASGTAPFTYQWYQGTSGTTTTPVGTNSASFTTPVLTADTSYWVKVSNAANLAGANSTTATVTVTLAAAIVTPPASVSINSGDTTTLGVTAAGTAPFSYQWYQGTSGDTTTPVGTNSASFTTPALTSATNYWVKVSNAANLVGANSATATVSINQPAAIVTSPASVTINSGDTTTLSVTASGTAPLSYQWYQGTSGTTTTPVGTNSASFTTPALTSTTNYWVKVTNTANLTGDNSTTATVTVNQPAAILTSPASVTINSGDTTTLSVTASGTAPLTYQWYQGTSGTTTTPVGTNSASFTTPVLTATTNYWVNVTNAANLTGANSTTATVTVNQPAAIVTSPASVTINSGDTTALSVTASGTAPLTYQWYQGTSGTTTTPVGTNSASFTTPTLSTTNDYWVKVTNSANLTGANSSTATVTVNQPAAIVTSPASVTINSGDTTTLSITASGTAPFTYQWYQGASGTTTTPVGTNSASFTTPVLTSTTSYWVKVTNAANLTGANSTTATVTVNQPAAIVMSPASVTINSGETTTLSVTTSGTAPLTYQWYQGASGTTTTPVGTDSPSFTTPALTATTSYWVKVSNAANLTGVNSTTATVTVNQPAGITTSPGSVTINNGDSTTLSVTASGTAPFTYQWYQGTSGITTTPVGTNSASFTTPALTATASYWVKVTNAANLTGADSTTAKVTVNQPAAIVTSPASVTINSGDTTTLSVTASGTAPLTYQWYQGISGTTTTPVGTNSASFTTPALTSTTSYWVKVTNAANLTGANSTTATVTVNQPAAIVTSPASVSINSGDTTTLSVTASGTAPLTYQWYQGVSGTTTTPVGTDSASFTTPALTLATSYWVKVTNAANLTGSNSSTATVSVNQPAAVVTSPASVTINSGNTTTLSVTTSGTAPFTYQWYQGSSGTTTTPVGTNSASFTTPILTVTTNYWVKVTNVANLAGSNSSTATVTVNQPAGITTSPASVSINSGDTTTLSVTPSGTAPFTYQWYQGISGVTTTPVGTNSASFTTPALTTTTSYWVKVTNAANLTGANSTTATVTVSRFTLTTSGNNGTITGAGTYDNMVMATLQATAAPGYTFSGWTGDASGTTNPLSLLMNSNKNVRAIFTAAGPFTLCFVGTPFEPRVGNKITLDLKRLTTLPGETVRLIGRLPIGLAFNRNTGIITGTIKGQPGLYSLNVEILRGTWVVQRIYFPINVLPFPTSLVGSFDGILEDVDSLPSGVFRLTITGPNAWSATLEAVGSPKRSIRGTFLLGEGVPTAPITALFPASRGVPAVTVNLTVDGANPVFTGSYSGGTLRGFRLASGTEIPSAIPACNLVLDAGLQDGINIPAGLGWMKGSFGTTGIGNFSGLLGDGTAITTTLRLSPTGQAVFWAQPYTNKNSYIGGIVTLNNLGQSANRSQKLKDGLWWSKKADVKTLSYPNGFPAMPVTLGTGKWTAPATASALGVSLGLIDRSASVSIDGAGLSNQYPQSTTAKLPTEFMIEDKFNLVTTAPSATLLVPWKGEVEKSEGSFAGNLTIPTGFSGGIPSGPAAVSGVLLQEDSWGTIVGCGLIKVPTNGANGSYRTAAIILEQ